MKLRTEKEKRSEMLKMDQKSISMQSIYMVHPAVRDQNAVIPVQYSTDNQNDSLPRSPPNCYSQGDATTYSIFQAPAPSLSN
ncbi:hypothetical protein O6P43_016847 [Quillaja saponaria]|uniref:Uncharacterized protein n=1 Tax=Quillaja saponaria TaxID=32244 RepID=A0AAD7PNR0_QUISA|nr:hypothetical protein O6P43_016847 [Quillaja saponaria]